MRDERSGGPDRSWQQYLKGESASGDGPAGDDARSRHGEGGEAPSSRSTRVVIPPEENEYEGARRRRRRLLIGAAVVLSAIALALLLLGAPSPEAGGGEGEAPAAEAPTAESPEADPPPADAAGESGPDAAAAALFAARADSLADAIRSFRVRRRDFGLNRIGCDGLARGLEGVRALSSRLSAAREAAGPALGAEGEERHRRLSEEVGGVERSFEEAGCGAPP